MSDDKLDLKLNVDVDVHDAEKAKALREELERIDAELRAIAKHTNESFRGLGALAKSLGRVKPVNGSTADGTRDAATAERDAMASLRKRFSFERRMSAQRRSEEGEASRAARDDAREVEARFREQMRFNTAMQRQREREARETESAIRREMAETAKISDRQARDAIRRANEVRRAEERAQERARSQLSRGAGQVRSGGGRAVVGAGAAGIGAAYLAERVLDSLTRSGVSLDRAVNANIRLSGLDPKAAAVKGKELARQAAPIARKLGIKTADYLAGRAEALQAGVDESLVDAVTEFGSKYAKLNDLSAPEVLESSGYGITALSSFGKVGIDQVKQLFNKQQYLAATTAASRQGLAAFVRRGLSAGAAAGFNLDDTLAYGGAATSSGADGESAARMLSSTTERIAMMPTRAADLQRKKHKTLKDRAILQLPKKLGFASWKDLKNSFSQDSAGVMEKIYEGLAGITDPRERLEASEEIFGREFGAVHSAIAVGHRFRDMRKAVRSKEAGNAIDSGMAIKAGSFDFIMDQIGATIQSLKDGLGMELLPFWSDIRDWSLKAPKAFESFNIAFREGISGFLTGLGSPDGTMAGFLKSWMGDPASFTINATAVKDFARGVGEGLREIGSAITSFVRVFAGSNASPEEMGRWTARILGLSAALLVAAPAVAVLGGLATAISGFCTIIMSTYGLMKAAGLVGGAGAAPKLPGGPAAAASSGWLSMFSRLFPAFAMPLTTDASKADQDAMMKKLGAYALEIEKNKQAIERQKDATEGNTEALKDGARIQRQSFDQGEDFRSLIQKAGYTTSATVTDSIRATAARAAASPLSGSVGVGGPALAYSNPGGSLRSGLSGMPRRGVIGGGVSSGSGNGKMPTSSTAGSLTDLINQEAIRAGIDPRVMQGIRAGESGHRADYDVKSDRVEDSYGPFQLNRRGGLGAVFERETGLDARDPKTIPAQTRWVAELIKKRGPGVLRQWYGYRGPRDADPSWGNSGYVPNNPAGAATAGNGANDNSPPNVGSAGYSKSRLAGQIDLEGVKYDYGSGGHRGANSIPVGTYPITPNTIGPWGRSHGALGINNNAIFDKELGRMRTGIEFHAASSASKLTAGCLGIARGQYAAFRAHVLKVIREQGSAYLTVGEDGRATITGGSPAIAGAKRMEKGIAESAEKAKASPIQKPTGAAGDDLVRRPGQDIGGGIIQKMPFTRLGTDTPLRGGGERPMSGSQSSPQAGMTVNNHFHGSGQNHEELANAVQRKLGDDMRRRSHDLDYGYG